jgi:hypothetical protein
MWTVAAGFPAAEPGAMARRFIEHKAEGEHDCKKL